MVIADRIDNIYGFVASPGNIQWGPASLEIRNMQFQNDQVQESY